MLFIVPVAVCQPLLKFDMIRNYPLSSVELINVFDLTSGHRSIDPAAASRAVAAVPAAFATVLIRQ